MAPRQRETCACSGSTAALNVSGAQNLAHLAADDGDQSVVGLRQQLVVLYPAQEGAEDGLARRRAAEKLAVHKGAGQHGAALDGRNQEAEAFGQAADFGFVVHEVDGDGRGVRDGAEIAAEHGVDRGEQRTGCPRGRGHDERVEFVARTPRLQRSSLSAVFLIALTGVAVRTLAGLSRAVMASTNSPCRRAAR